MNRFSTLDLGLKSGMETMVIEDSRHTSQLVLPVIHFPFHMEVQITLQCMRIYLEVHTLEDSLLFFRIHQLHHLVLLHL